MRLACLIISVSSLLPLSGCMSMQEMQEVREAREAELQKMVEAGLCEERLRTGSRTKSVWICSEDGGPSRESVNIAQESMRKLQDKGGLRTKSPM